MTRIFLTMLLMTCICEGALIRKSSASDFLLTRRERRDVECHFGDCSGESSEVEELLNTPPHDEDTSDVLYDGNIEQTENEDTTDVLFDGNREQTEKVETGVLVSDHPAPVNGPDEQKVHPVGLGPVEGSGM